MAGDDTSTLGHVRIPNYEARLGFWFSWLENLARDYWEPSDKAVTADKLHQAIIQGDALSFQKYLADVFHGVFYLSAGKVGEMAYALFLFGLLSQGPATADGWEYSTEVEDVHGRVDIKLCKEGEPIGAMFSFKEGSQLWQLTDVALQQLSDKRDRYTFGDEVLRVFEYGIAVDERRSCTRLRTMFRETHEGRWREEALEPVCFGLKKEKRLPEPSDGPQIVGREVETRPSPSRFSPWKYIQLRA